MFCYQCEQTAKGSGCTSIGVCTKDETTAKMQDLLIHSVKGIAMYARRALDLGARERQADEFVILALFSTLTNVDFDSDRISELLRQADEIKAKVKNTYEKAAIAAGVKVETLSGAAHVDHKRDRDELMTQAEVISIPNRQRILGEDIIGLQELITYGIKGVAAYLYHAEALDKDDPELFRELYGALDFLTEDSPSVDDLLAWALRVGELNFKAMELLDAAHTEHFGHPEPTQVRITPVRGKAILVSGHDLKDLEELLVQTAGAGVNVYTHGEMLPANAYPGLKKHPHLIGNYGGAWQNQQSEFDDFPGAILLTTNCLMRPRDSYKDRLFTTGPVAWPGIMHIAENDFSPVIKAAMSAPGFDQDAPEASITIGFGHQTVLSAAGQVVNAVKNGHIRHFFLIGGCDGAKQGRNYYTELAESVPQDCMILTLACGKYRFNKLDFGEIDGIPRLLDIGQCNDAYSAIVIASALADAFECSVNELPLSMILSWYEQKAVAILLTLLNLGIKNIRLGPSLPAFVTPAALNVLIEKFNIMPISTPREDLEAILEEPVQV